MFKEHEIKEEINAALSVDGIHRLRNSEIMIENVNTMVNFFDEKELWDTIVMCDCENITYFLIYALMILAVSEDCDYKVENPEKYYDFGCEWVRKNYDHYLGCQGKGFTNDIFGSMLVDFAKIISNSTESEEENEG